MRNNITVYGEAQQQHYNINFIILSIKSHSAT